MYYGLEKDHNVPSKSHRTALSNADPLCQYFKKVTEKLKFGEASLVREMSSNT